MTRLTCETFQTGIRHVMQIGHVGQSTVMTVSDQLEAQSNSEIHRSLRNQA